MRLNDATAGDWLIFRAVIPDQILISNMVPFKDNYDTVAGRWHLAGGPTDVLLWRYDHNWQGSWSIVGFCRLLGTCLAVGGGARGK